MGQTLLERALEVPALTPHDNSITTEDMELALAWAFDRVTMKQIQAVLKSRSTTGPLSYLARALREAVRSGYLGTMRPQA